VQGEITNKIVEVCKVLNNHSVKYLIVGGTAVAFHGYFRWSVNSTASASEKFDLDFWYNPTYTNYYNLLNALGDLGQDIEVYKNEKEPKPKTSFFKFEIENFTIDFLPSLKGLSKFNPSYNHRDIVEINEIQLSFINIDDLITDKAVNSRPKDLEDIKQLKRRKLE
jgi:predicted nucleotidyltransferase